MEPSVEIPFEVLLAIFVTQIIRDLKMNFNCSFPVKLTLLKLAIYL